MMVLEYLSINKFKKYKIKAACLEFRDLLENSHKLFNKILSNAQILIVRKHSLYPHQVDNLAFIGLVKEPQKMKQNLLRKLEKH